jgi:mannose-6-phosphate isomerase-like protein (cupin superfamily)
MNEPVTMEWLMEDAIDDRAGLSLARMSVDINVTSPLHHHPNCAETIYLLDGEIEQRIGEKWIKMSAGDSAVVPRNSQHQSRNIGNVRAVMMVAYSAGKREYIAD